MRIPEEGQITIPEKSPSICEIASTWDPMLRLRLRQPKAVCSSKGEPQTVIP